MTEAINHRDALNESPVVLYGVAETVVHLYVLEEIAVLAGTAEPVVYLDARNESPLVLFGAWE